MPVHDPGNNAITLLPPETISRGLPPGKRQADNKILELMAWRARRDRKKEAYRYKTNKTYFENQRMIQMRY